MSPEDRVVSNVTDALEIVRELAERGPFDNDEQGMCATCPPEFPQRWGMNNQVPAEHDPACLWRRARELYPQPVVD